jgi:hypothetical protein
MSKIGRKRAKISALLPFQHWIFVTIDIDLYQIEANNRLALHEGVQSVDTGSRTPPFFCLALRTNWKRRN